ncbi:hypothetical protein CI15_18680 [Paraburkholderia monticola]|uniref:Uncharacterized protein n=1 Tax=Paraburkholderia monticola TaxID=1399968 RepID=A0A149PNJ8_9BURK|nr:hypothetical protein [Paraburkholderia monticola]KXU86466.1 hypothetical protein CI15_18680 [Paraburkholderia monticola]
MLDNNTTKAIIKQHLPRFLSRPQIGMAQCMGPSTVAKFSNGLIIEDALRKIDAALKVVLR